MIHKANLPSNSKAGAPHTTNCRMQPKCPEPTDARTHTHTLYRGSPATAARAETAETTAAAAATAAETAAAAFPAQRAVAKRAGDL